MNQVTIKRLEDRMKTDNIPSVNDTGLRIKAILISDAITNINAIMEELKDKGYDETLSLVDSLLNKI